MSTSAMYPTKVHWHSNVGPVLFGSPICVDQELDINSLGILPTMYSSYGEESESERQELWWKLSVQSAYMDCCRRYAYDSSLKNNPSLVLSAKIPPDKGDDDQFADARMLEIDYICVQASFDHIVSTSTEASGCIMSSTRSLTTGYLLGNIDVPTYAIYACNPDRVLTWDSWRSWMRFILKLIMLLIVIGMGFSIVLTTISVLIGSQIESCQSVKKNKKDESKEDTILTKSATESTANKDWNNWDRFGEDEKSNSS